MGPELIAYPFLFIAIFFESFILVTLLSAPAKLARKRTGGRDEALPTVAVIVPCYNEASTVAATCASLLALSYPKEKLEVILVDDGSSDETPFAMAAFATHPQVKIIRKENGGKHTALNAGIAATKADIVGCLDADSFVEPDALKEMIPCFRDPNVAAATAAMSVHEPQNVLQHMQNAEYIFGISLRHSLASINAIHVTPGPFSLYRKSTIEVVGGFRHGHQTEDMEMALRLQKEGYAIENAPRARVYTKAPSTVSKLIKQRVRWTSGFLRNALNEYRGLIGNRRYGTLGTLVLPFGLLSVGGTVVLFGLSLLTFGTHAFAAYETRMGIPLSYALQAEHLSLDWFYLPASSYMAFVLVIFLAGLLLTILGKRLSKTPGPLTLGFIAYAFLYGLIAPFWLMKATTDLVLGKKRAWR